MQTFPNKNVYLLLYFYHSQIIDNMIYITGHWVQGPFVNFLPGAPTDCRKHHWPGSRWGRSPGTEQHK